MRLRIPILLSMTLSYPVYANGFQAEEVRQWDAVCREGAANHERRIFDALSNSEYLDWTKIELMEIESRFNYTDTSTIGEEEQRVNCDVMISYTYQNKPITLSSVYQVATDERETLSSVKVTERAVIDFIVRVMVN
ncbi:hypothetical protein [Vibrio sp. TBV020]|uniref:hypothetical protein n=1 Tax=Vibrio sp. TBV020 TaxID=3137398 RepID=UPI0038CD8138